MIFGIFQHSLQWKLSAILLLSKISGRDKPEEKNNDILEFGSKDVIMKIGFIKDNESCRDQRNEPWKDICGREKNVW